MKPEIPYIVSFAVLFALIVWLDRKYGMLRGAAPAKGARPYSFSRVQLAWWSMIILAGFVAIIFTSGGMIPDLNQDTLILLGISAATVATASVIDTPSPGQTSVPLPAGENLFLDILSDQNGVNIHRFQTVVFNFVFGCWFVYKICSNQCDDPTQQLCINSLVPDIGQNNLILLGLSNGTYAALKVGENKQSPSAPETLPDEGTTGN